MTCFVDTNQEYIIPLEEPLYFNDKYLYDNRWYHENFPVEWAVDHLEDTGPNECLNCEDYGCINGIFIGYCVNCATHVYNGSRGRGFIDYGIEYNGDEVLNKPSVFDTYLKDVNVFDIEPIITYDEDNDYRMDVDDYDDRMDVDNSDDSMDI
jgi:hypothetical protein